MFTTLEAPVQQLSREQAIELSLLVDLEAQWENLRITQPTVGGMPSTLKELNQKQRAYEAFFAKLVIYNKKYKPTHVAELLLNNAARLGKWCSGMRDLILQIEHTPQVHYPSHLLAKAYRWADRVADRMKTERIPRTTPSMNIQDAIQELEELSRWCNHLSRIAS